MTEKEATALSRRRVFAGLGTAGALAGAAAVLPMVRETPPTAEPKAKPPEAGGGYRLTAHVQRYYQTAKV